jgi:hypothetical protein
MAGDRIIANIGPPRSDALGVAWVGRAVIGGDAHDDLVLSGLLDGVGGRVGRHAQARRALGNLARKMVRASAICTGSPTSTWAVPCSSRPARRSCTGAGGWRLRHHRLRSWWAGQRIRPWSARAYWTGRV